MSSYEVKPVKQVAELQVLRVRELKHVTPLPKPVLALEVHAQDKLRESVILNLNQVHVLLRWQSTARELNP